MFFFVFMLNNERNFRKFFLKIKSKNVVVHVKSLGITYPQVEFPLQLRIAKNAGYNS